MRPRNMKHWHFVVYARGSEGDQYLVPDKTIVNAMQTNGESAAFVEEYFQFMKSSTKESWLD